MNNYYCPLISKKGEFLALSEINHSHLSQLTEIEEGYKVEYKSQWNDSVKQKHLANVITSFANSEGGWMFIGIEDRTGKIVEIDEERTDFEQQIGQIVKSKASPYPRFETRFIRNPASPKRGVLIIHIFEGIEPPYISNGTIYMRIGSSKVPVPASNRSEIDTLVAKRTSMKQRLEDFCKNEIFDDDEFPFCLIYLFNQGEPNKIIDFENIKQTISEIAKRHNFRAWKPAMTSFLLFNAGNVSENSRSGLAELYTNYNIKLYLPLTLAPDRVNNWIINHVKKRTPQFSLEGFSALDGYLTSSFISAHLKSACSILLENNIVLDDYIVRIELHNIKNCFIFFPTPDETWTSFIKHNHLSYSNKSYARYPDMDIGAYLSDLNETTLDSKAMAIVNYVVMSAFGILTDDFIRLFNTADKHVKEIMKVDQYRTEEYFGRIYGIGANQ